MGKGKKNSNKKKTPADKRVDEAEGGLLVDPARVRFQHSRIRPFFSGCGRSVTETLDSIRRKEMSPSDLPPIQVIVGPTTEDGPNYFSLNNRRLWVLKRCREEGLLEDNRVFVRVREPKSTAEAARYSIDNCALEAKIVPFKEKGGDDNNDDERAKGDSDADTTSISKSQKDEIHIEQGGGSHDDKKANEIHKGDEGSDDESSESDDDDVPSTNRFSALF